MKTTLIAALVLFLCTNAQQIHAASDSGNIGERRVISTNPTLTQEAIAYFGKLTQPLTDFKKANYDYLKTITRTRRIKKIEKQRQKLLKVIDIIKVHVKECGPFKEDNALQSKLQRYSELVYIVLKEDFGKILDMEDIIEQSYDQEEAHQLALDMAVEKLNATFKVLRNAEQDYAEKYQFTLVDKEDKLSRKIEKANNAIDYYNKIHRIFYKVNKQDFYARSAANENDIAALEQHLMTLTSYTEEGLEKLARQTPYNEDNTLLTTAVNLVEFYKHEAEVTYPAVIEFHLLSDRFQKTMKKFNAIKQSDRTKEHVNAYNSEVDKYNKTVKMINKTNKTSIKQNKKLIKLWNKRVDVFFRKHS